MKKTVYTILLTLFVTASVFAQRPDREKINALKIAHLTEQLNLTKTEAQKFWPIYNANEEAKQKLREKSSLLRNGKTTEELSESEAKSLLLSMVSIEKEKAELQSQFLDDLLEVLSAKKIVALVQAEKSFRHKMLQEFKSRHSERKNKN